MQLLPVDVDTVSTTSGIQLQADDRVLTKPLRGAARAPVWAWICYLSYRGAEVGKVLQEPGEEAGVGAGVGAGEGAGVGAGLTGTQ